jgi:predicted enzyme related to lactoylglutathione lyase
MQMLVNIDVEELERAIGFYTSALDLRLGRRLFGGAVAELLGASSAIYLISRPAGAPAWRSANAGREYGRHWTPVHLDFAVADVAAAVQRAVAAGARLEGAIETFAWGGLATLSDPFGHGFCLLQFSAAGYDAVTVPAPR